MTSKVKSKIITTNNVIYNNTTFSQNHMSNENRIIHFNNSICLKKNYKKMIKKLNITFISKSLIFNRVVPTGIEPISSV